MQAPRGGRSHSDSGEAASAGAGEVREDAAGLPQVPRQRPGPPQAEERLLQQGLHRVERRVLLVS